MKKLVLLIMFYGLTLSYSQNYGYLGKRFEISPYVGLSVNPAYLNNMRYGIDKQTPSGISLPLTYGIQMAAAIGRTGIGFQYSVSRNFVGFAVPEGLSTIYTDQDNGSSLQSVPMYIPYRLRRNYYANTSYAGFEIRRYSYGFSAPAGNYLRLGFGRITASYDEDEVFEYSTRNYYYGNEIEGSYDPEKTIKPLLDSPEYSFYLISFGYNVRNQIPLGNSLFWDFGGTLSFGLGRPAEVQRLGRIDRGHSVEGLDESGFEGMIEGTTYVYIIKHNAFRLNTGIVFLF